METFDNISDKIWQVIHVICELWTFLTILATIIWFVCPPNWKEKIKVLFRRAASKLNKDDMPSLIQRLLFDDITPIDGFYKDYNFKFHLGDEEVNVPEDFKCIADRLRKENEERMLKGEEPVYTDLHPYAVHSILTPREETEMKKIERPTCYIGLRESSYFYSLVSIMAMNERVGEMTIRDKYYCKLLENPDKPTPDGYDVVHALGINTLIYTNDGKFVFGERNPSTVATGQGCLHLSVGEHLNKMLIDFNNENNEPDITKTLIRGINEELGINVNKLKEVDIRFYGLALSKRLCQYGVLGITILSNFSSTDIEREWVFSKDGRYENRRLVAINADLRSIVDYMNKNPHATMTKFALLNVCLALMKEDILGSISKEKINKELKRLRKDALVG